MNTIADALVYATTYINCRDMEDVDDEEADASALESIAGFLSGATPAEEDKLAAVAERARAAELKHAPQPRVDFLQDYENWMQDMFGDGWKRNRRV
jgi:hypothetical protein